MYWECWKNVKSDRNDIAKAVTITRQKHKSCGYMEIEVFFFIVRKFWISAYVGTSKKLDGLYIENDVFLLCCFVEFRAPWMNLVMRLWACTKQATAIQATHPYMKEVTNFYRAHRFNLYDQQRTTEDYFLNTLRPRKPKFFVGKTSKYFFPWTRDSPK